MIFLGKANIATQIPPPPPWRKYPWCLLVEHSDVTHRQFDWCLAVPWHYHQDTNCFKNKTLKFDGYSWEICFLFWEETSTTLQSIMHATLSQQRFCRCHVTKQVHQDNCNDTCYNLFVWVPNQFPLTKDQGLARFLKILIKEKLTWTAKV